MKTPIEKLLEIITLKEKENAIYLMPIIDKIDINKLISEEKQLNLCDVSHLLIAWEEYKLANMYESDYINVEKMLMERFVAIYCG